VVVVLLSLFLSMHEGDAFDNAGGGGGGGGGGGVGVDDSAYSFGRWWNVEAGARHTSILSLLVRSIANF
jgi:hypothetical protein